MKYIPYFLLINLSSIVFAQLPSGLKLAIQNHEYLFEGGADLLQWNKDSTFVVGVGYVEISNKNKRASSLRRIGTIKAKNEVIKFLDGSDITSSRTIQTSETSKIVNGEEIYSSFEKYIETIREDTDSFVKGMKNVGGWYSEDRSQYFFAVARLILNN